VLCSSSNMDVRFLQVVILVTGQVQSLVCLFRVHAQVYGVHMCKCTCMHAHTRAHTRARTHTRTHTHARTHTRTHARAHTRTRTRTHTHTHTHTTSFTDSLIL